LPGDGYNFQGAVFPTSFSFAGAWLQYAKFSNASLIGADFTGANLSGADLRNAVLTGIIVDGVTVDDKTLTDSIFQLGDHSVAAVGDGQTYVTVAVNWGESGFLLASLYGHGNYVPDNASSSISADVAGVHVAACQNATSGLLTFVVTSLYSASLLAPQPPHWAINFQQRNKSGFQTLTLQKYSIRGGHIGTPKSIGLGSSHNAPGDGLVVAYVDSNNPDYTWGQITGSQGANESTENMIAGASHYCWPAFQFNVHSNSFCMPVCENNQYRVDYKFDGEGTAKAWFVPLSLLLPLSQPVPLGPPVNNKITGTANEDGFLVVFLGTGLGFWSSTMNSASVIISVGATETALKQVASTSAETYLVFVPYNTATVPVPKTYTYEILVQAVGTPAVQVWWFALKAPGS
jgi:hypothetical protein